MINLSIITINYNNKVGLSKTIKSVINQTYADFEYIIIDGASTDESVKIINENTYKITYWISEPDAGIYDAMNKGIKHSEGKWIIFMNSGDLFADRNVLENIFNNPINNNIKILYGNTIILDKNIKIKPSSKINKNYFFFDSLCHQSIFFRKELFDNIGCFSLKFKIISDNEFLLRAVMKNINFKYIDADICIWEPIGYASNNKKLLVEEAKKMRYLYFNIFEIILLKLMRRFSFIKSKNVVLSYKIN